MKITSVKNPQVKTLLDLQSKSRERKKQGLFVVEGARELSLLVQGGWAIHTLYFCKEVAKTNMRMLEEGPLSSLPQVELDRAVYEKVAYRENSEGVMALVHTRDIAFQDLRLPENPLILVCESVEKPGNLGALLRTADAAKVDAVILCDPLSDLYNPNVIRSSVGCFFTQRIVVTDSSEALAWLQQKGISIFATALTASIPHWKAPLNGPAAIIMGTEATGLSSIWLQGATQNIIIPMGGTIDSLNVSVAAAVVLFEARRQRDNV